MEWKESGEDEELWWNEESVCGRGNCGRKYKDIGGIGE